MSPASPPDARVADSPDPMPGLAEVVASGLHDLRRLVEAWQVAVNVLHLGYGPAGMDYAPRRRGSGGVERPVPVSDRMPVTKLSRAHTESAVALAGAVRSVAQLSWMPSEVAAVAVVPDGSHVPHDRAMRMAQEVRFGLEGTAWRLEPWDFEVRPPLHGPHRRPSRRSVPFADGIHVRGVCHQVAAALARLPGELYVEAPGRVQPTHRECPGYVFYVCGRTIPFEAKRCDECQTAADRIRALSHGDHDDVCRNPWGRRACRGDVASARYVLCASCDQYRRDGARKAS